MNPDRPNQTITRSSFLNSRPNAARHIRGRPRRHVYLSLVSIRHVLWRHIWNADHIYHGLCSGDYRYFSPSFELIRFSFDIQLCIHSYVGDDFGSRIVFSRPDCQLHVILRTCYVAENWASSRPRGTCITMQSTAVSARVCICGVCVCVTLQSHYDSKLLKDNTFYIERPLPSSVSVLLSETA